MSGKRDRQLRKQREQRERREARLQEQVICDACELRQPFSRGDGSRHANGELDIAGCIGCGHHYGSWA